jgi:glycosyltransferase involved in cell wall biosynthesis
LNSTSRASGAFRIAAVVEDLRLPLDEGAKKTCYSLIRALRGMGVEVCAFTRYANPLLPDASPLPHNKLLWGPAFSRSLNAHIPDFILYIPASSGTMGAFARAAAIKIQSRGRPLALLNLQYRDLPGTARYLQLHKWVDIVFAQSQASADVLGSLGCKTVLLPGGVDLKAFHPVSKQEKRLLRLKHGLLDDEQVVLHIGHCNRGRSVATLARLVERGFRAILIASTSTDIDRELLAELKRSGVTVVTDYVEHIEHFYQLADCYLFPVANATSAVDAPLSILEAMACNLPVVTTRFGALPRLFEPGSGLYYGETEQELVCLVAQALHERDCRTLEKVCPYSWDSVAASILERLKEGCTS